MAVMFSPPFLWFAGRAIRDYSLFRVYLVLETSLMSLTFLLGSSLPPKPGAIIAIYKVANMKGGLAGPWQCLPKSGSLECHQVFHSLVLEAPWRPGGSRWSWGKCRWPIMLFLAVKGFHSRLISTNTWILKGKTALAYSRNHSLMILLG